MMDTGSSGSGPLIAPPHWPQQQAPSASEQLIVAVPASDMIVPDQSRAILAFDVDCFYAQCEEVRNPALRGRPVGVTQKYLVVTANYAARTAGVGKLQGIQEAKKQCPDLVLIPGEDLGPYRTASQAILTVLERYGPACRQGLDEVFVDATEVCMSRLSAGVSPAGFIGHVHCGSDSLVADTHWRPQDLRAVAAGVIASSTCALTSSAAGQQPQPPPPEPSVHQAREAQTRSGGYPAGWGIEPGSQPPAWLPLLQIASHIAAEARAAVLAETGFRCSAGVACNKALAKLSSGLHKPDDQTVLPPPEALAFLSPLPARALPGVGYKTDRALTDLGVTTVSQLRALPKARLIGCFGERVGSMLYGLARGLDASPITPQGPPKSITVEDSFKSCSTIQAAEAVIQVLAPDLLARVQEDWVDHQRCPATLTIKWRHRSEGMARSSASVTWPVPHCAAWGHVGADGHVIVSPQHVAALVSTSVRLLASKLRGTQFNLTLINLGACNMKPLKQTEAASRGQASLDRFITAVSTPAGKATHSGADAQRAGSSNAWCAAGSGVVCGAGSVQQDVSKVASRAAELSTASRRDYGSSPAGLILLPKSRERKQREAGECVVPYPDSSPGGAAAVCHAGRWQAGEVQAQMLAVEAPQERMLPLGMTLPTTQQQAVDHTASAPEGFLTVQPALVPSIQHNSQDADAAATWLPSPSPAAVAAPCQAPDLRALPAPAAGRSPPSPALPAPAAGRSPPSPALPAPAAGRSPPSPALPHSDDGDTFEFVTHTTARRASRRQSEARAEVSGAQQPTLEPQHAPIGSQQVHMGTQCVTLVHQGTSSPAGVNGSELHSALSGIKHELGAGASSSFLQHVPSARMCEVLDGDTDMGSAAGDLPCPAPNSTGTALPLPAQPGVRMSEQAPENGVRSIPDQHLNSLDVLVKQEVNTVVMQGKPALQTMVMGGGDAAAVQVPLTQQQIREQEEADWQLARRLQREEDAAARQGAQLAAASMRPSWASSSSSRAGTAGGSRGRARSGAGNQAGRHSQPTLDQFFKKASP